MIRMSTAFALTIMICAFMPSIETSASVITPKSDDSANRFHELLKAKSSQELRNLIQKSDELDKTRLTCSVQLRGKKVPTACFAVLRLEKEARLLTDSAEKEELLWLVPLCITRAKESHDWRELSEASRSASLPVACLNTASEREQDLRYSAQSEHPEDLFARRFD